VMDVSNNIPKKLEERRGYRRQRRSRNTRYRKPRFNNRKKEERWLAPSIRHKLHLHKRLVEEIQEILPVDDIIVEVAKFDTQKMENPEIKGKEYQHGTLHGYNIKHYLLEKFNYECIYCGAKDTPLEVEHIVPKSRGGSDRVDNLTISCHDCNQ
ncbi:MAG: HNH endonuclease, partial [Methanonatronarchaeia archaeon]